MHAVRMVRELSNQSEFRAILVRVKKLVFENKRDVLVLKIVGGILLFVILVQQALPSHKPLPFARFNGHLQRISSEQQITNLYSSILDNKLDIIVNDQTFTYKVRDLGISLNTQKSLEQFYPESRLKRLIPFSTLLQINHQRVPYYSSNRKAMRIVTRDIAQKSLVAPIDSRLQLIGEELIASASKPGQIVDAKVAENFILDAVSRKSSSVTLSVQTSEPAVSFENLTKSVTTFTKDIPATIPITIDELHLSLAKRDILSWIKVNAGAANLLDFDQKKIETYATALASVYFADLAPTPTLITLENGKETTRTDGRPGKSLDVASFSTHLREALSSKTYEVAGTLIDTPSPISYTRNYTNSSEGLQNLLTELTRDREISIRYIDVNARGWDISSDADTEYQMASTYKLFVAYSTLLRIESGEFSWDDEAADTDLSTCFDRMIIESDNTCALAIAETIGWDAIQYEGFKLGATGLNWTDDVYGTANDVAILLKEIASGNILNTSSRERLIQDMKEQVYRAGIPAGSDYQVADKVGFMESGLHDGAIIYAPDLTHVLVIFTNDSSWDEIASMTKQIESLALHN